MYFLDCKDGLRPMIAVWRRPPAIGRTTVSRRSPRPFTAPPGGNVVGACGRVELCSSCCDSATLRRGQASRAVLLSVASVPLRSAGTHDRDRRNDKPASRGGFRFPHVERVVISVVLQFGAAETWCVFPQSGRRATLSSSASRDFAEADGCLTSQAGNERAIDVPLPLRHLSTLASLSRIGRLVAAGPPRERPTCGRQL